MRDFNFGIVVGWFTCLSFLMIVGVLVKDPVCFDYLFDKREAWHYEVAAYNSCMENAGKAGCHMTPQDFVRYYQLKKWLENKE